MFCQHCGKEIDEHVAFCSYCGASTGTSVSPTSPDSSNLLYHLPLSKRRECDIRVYEDRVAFRGKFWYLVDKEFIKSKSDQEMAKVSNFLGLGYLTEGVDKINSYLQWMGHSISLPDWMNTTMNVLAVICLLLGLVLFFSKKKVIEISFTDKRICVPQKSMSSAEYQTLYQTLIHTRNQNRGHKIEK